MALAGIVAVVALGTAHIQTGKVLGPRSEDPTVDLLLLDVLYDHLRLETALAALQDGRGQRFLPLRQLAASLGFRLHVDTSKRVLSGFLANPGDRIALNGITGRCVHKGKTILFDSALCFERDGELYLEAEVLQRVTGLHFEWRLNRLELNVSSDTPLAIRQQWLQRRIFDKQKIPAQLRLPVVRTPYNLWSLPALDMQWYTDANVKDQPIQSASRLQIEGRGDFLFMNARYRFISGAGSKPAAFLVSFGRQDPHASLGGFLHATQFSVGDLTLSQLPLFARARNGLGATVSNFPLPGTQATAPTQLEGRAPAASRVELYRANDLLASGLADAQGRYVFSAIPLESGPNDLRVVVISPEGDIHEEQRTLYGDANGPLPGKGQYRLTAAQVGNSIFPHGIAGISDDRRRTEYIGEYQWGLPGGSWLSATAADTHGSGGNATFLGAGLHSWGHGMLWHIETMASDNGGTAFSAGISRKLGGLTLSLEHTLASAAFGAKLVPEIGSDATAITRFRLDGSTGDRRHPISFGLSADRMNGSSPSTLLRGHVSGGDGKTFISNTLAMRLSNDPLDLSGLLQVRRPFGSMLGRFDVGYAFGTNDILQTVQMSFDRRISSAYRVRFGLNYDVTRTSRFESIGTLYRLLGPLEVGVNLALNPQGAMKANFMLSVGVAGGGDSNSRVAFARPGSSDTGSVWVRVYLDRNFNGTFDQQDLLLPNVGLKVGGRHSAGKTDKNGKCFVDRLATEQEIAVALNEDSFEDPCWSPATAGVFVIPRSGRVAKVDLGVIEAAEIEGRVEGYDPVRMGLTAQLVDYLGKINKTSVLDEDGIYVFSHVWPGDYTLRLVDAAGKAYGNRLLRVAPGAMMKGCDIKAGIPKQFLQVTPNARDNRTLRHKSDRHVDDLTSF